MRVSRFVLGAAALGVLAGSSAAGVMMDGHFITGKIHGDWQLENSAFVPATQAPYGFDTLLVEEHVPGYIYDEEQEDARGSRPARPAERWSDLWVTVTRPGTRGTDMSSMIAFDKSVLNWTDQHWTDFHIEIGQGLHDNFSGVDGLDFKMDPLPQEENGLFPDPPTYMTDPVTGTPALWWDINKPIPASVDGQYPGVWPGETARFWFAINIPDFLFIPISGGGEAATVVLRQHWSPTPGAATALVGFGALATRRRRSN